MANNIPSVLIVLLRKKRIRTHAPQALLWPSITFHVESVRKKCHYSFIFLPTKKERSQYSSKKDEEDGIHYTFVDDRGCCGKLNVVILAGLTAGVACSERYSYSVQ